MDVAGEGNVFAIYFVWLAKDNKVEKFEKKTEEQNFQVNANKKKAEVAILIFL